MFFGKHDCKSDVLFHSNLHRNCESLVLRVLLGDGNFLCDSCLKKQTGEDMPSGILIGFRQCGSAYQSRISQNQELGFGQPLPSLGEVLTGGERQSADRQPTIWSANSFEGATRTYPNLSKLHSLGQFNVSPPRSNYLPACAVKSMISET